METALPWPIYLDFSDPLHFLSQAFPKTPDFFRL